ncbi:MULTISPECIES: hypothetical protein [unclassified Rathayibacter]|uniref:hypothetical protein n=1 Tax=unclassified Rathayibacter TaxID=2609250 RepID=UPI00188B5DAB|nr:MULTISPECIES: hypothetical protein [unclassified Rathayibacter]MBF4462693.1 hypothetical protein [Rathayibacter sp. VKM Ac-2879]MBF4504107.1 hypothetical protein [Rathayibacter sp. VKM Ac-2878]
MIRDSSGVAPEDEGLDDATDDDALAWAGEGVDPTLAAGEAPVRRSPRAAAGGDPGPDEEAGRADEGATASSSVLLVAAGVAAGLYLLSAIAWLITATKQNAVVAASFAGDALGGALYSLGLWLAVAAPIVWFAVVLLATREARVRTRVLWLIVGAVLLAPLPFVKGA